MREVSDAPIVGLDGDTAKASVRGPGYNSPLACAIREGAAGSKLKDRDFVRHLLSLKPGERLAALQNTN